MSPEPGASRRAENRERRTGARPVPRSGSVQLETGGAVHPDWMTRTAPNRGSVATPTDAGRLETSARQRKDWLVTNTSLDELGPVDYLVVEFPANASNFTGEMAKELIALV